MFGIFHFSGGFSRKCLPSARDRILPDTRSAASRTAIGRPGVTWWRRPCLVIGMLIALATPAGADAVEAAVKRISAQGVHEQLGTVVAVQRDGALEISLRLSPFPPGWHAMHVHEFPACGPAPEDGAQIAGGAAGRHFDPTGVMADMAGMADMTAMVHVAGKDDPSAMEPAKTPQQARRPRPLGDLPTIYTDDSGVTDTRILSYRLQLSQIRGRSLILHAHPEAVDDPRLPKGGGTKIACAVFPD